MCFSVLSSPSCFKKLCVQVNKDQIKAKHGNTSLPGNICSGKKILKQSTLKLYRITIHMHKLYSFRKRYILKLFIYFNLRSLTQCDSLIVTISFLLHLNEISKITSTFKVYIAFRGLCVSEFHKGRTSKYTQSRAMFKYSKRDLFSFFLFLWKVAL